MSWYIVDYVVRGCDQNLLDDKDWIHLEQSLSDIIAENQIVDYNPYQNNTHMLQDILLLHHWEMVHNPDNILGLLTYHTVSSG
jgi:hypothetical protein